MRLRIAILLALFVQVAHAAPVSTTPVRTLVGNIDFAVTGATLRSEPDSGNSCAVNGASSAVLSGIPAGATVRAAYLYWAGSGTTTDFSVTFNGAGIAADTQYTESISPTRNYFSGVADVTARISGNGSYSFSGLSVDTGGGYCAVSGVLAGWALVVVYDDPSEPFRTLNFFEGFQNFWGSSISLSPSNFVIPTAPIDGKLAVLSWEGDSGNSGLRNGVSENLFFDGQNTSVITLTDGLNPANNQFNSTINQSGITDSWGVDFDVYDISSRLRAGDTTASTTYQSGQDRVFLGLALMLVTNTPASDLSLSSSHIGNFAPGHLGQLNLNVTNNGPLDHTGSMVVTETLPAGMAFVSASSADSSWTCSGATTVTCSRPDLLAAGASAPTLTLLVQVASTASGSLLSSAIVSTASFDPFGSNNNAVDSIDIVVPDLSGSGKTVTDTNAGTPLAGEQLRFDITISDTATTQLTVDVLDTLHPLLSNFVVVDAAGGSDFSTATTLDLRAVPILPGQPTVIVITADIAGSAVSGDLITNTATLTNPVDGVVVSVSSLDLTVGAVTAASGIKPLYLGNLLGPNANNVQLPMSMSRTPLTSTSTPVNRVRIRRQDNNRQWLLNPAVAAPLGMDASDIPVTLLMRRNGSSASRQIRVSLDYVGAASGFIGCVDTTLSSAGANGLSNAITRAFVFNVPRTDTSCNPLPGGDLLLPAGTQIRLTVDNDPNVGPNGRAVFVYPFDAVLGNSAVELSATTVINVDSVEFFDAPYPGGVPVTSMLPGTTVTIRSTVSDPFGAFDISAVSLTLTDPGGVTQASAALDPANLVNTDASSKTYEFAFAFPADAAAGQWTANILALEGVENTVSHSGAGAITITGAPSILIEKSLVLAADPTGGTNPKAIPGSTLQFTISVTNSGPGSTDLDSIVIADSLPGDARLLFDPVTSNPLLFNDGTPASGLSYSFGGLGDPADDVEFSNDGGATFITPTIDAISGIDVTVPRINYLRVNPKGTLLSTATGPSFTLQILMRLD